MYQYLSSSNLSTSVERMPLVIDIEAELISYRKNLELIIALDKNLDKMDPNGKRFALDLVRQFASKRALSASQWDWASKLLNQAQEVKPLSGDFDEVFKFFETAFKSGLKVPKIRLITHADEYLLLRFISSDPAGRKIDIYQGGWANHGTRVYVGMIRDNQVKPYRGRMTNSMKIFIDKFSKDPLKVAKACAAQLGICTYCGLDLTTNESKHNGYGPICAKSWGLPWGHEHKHNH